MATITKGDIISSPQLFNILLIEDSKADIRLIKEFFKEFNIENVLYIFRDGIKAIEFLHIHCKPINSCCLDIVLLDLNLPRMSGLNVLKEIKKDNDLKRLPVIILSTSTSQEDIQECYENYANCYLVKSADFTGFESVMHSIKEYWFDVNKLPP